MKPILIAAALLMTASGPARAKGCGGDGQKACTIARAEYVSKQRTTCPPPSFYDPRNGGECWRCPNGFNRTMHPVTHANACARAYPETFAKATKRRGLSCGSGHFADLGRCWDCGSGFHRNIFRHTSNDKSCEKVHNAYYARKNATRHGKWGRAIKVAGIKVGTNWYCKGGWSSGPRDSCWRCTGGYHNNITKSWDTHNMCEKYHAAWTERRHARDVGPHYSACKAGEFFDPIDGGTCWTCPNSHPRRTGFHVKSDRACVKNAGEHLKHSAFQKNLPCPHGGFADPIDGGTCWKCPSGFRRSWASVKAKDACAGAPLAGLGKIFGGCDKGNVNVGGRCYKKGHCGGLYQRPCLLIERVPSCDKGLAEDFKVNKCVASRTPFLDGFQSMLSMVDIAKQACRRDVKYYKFGENDLKLKAKPGTGRDVGICFSEMATGFTCGPLDFGNKLNGLIDTGRWIVEAAGNPGELQEQTMDVPRILRQMEKEYKSAACTSMQGFYYKATKTKKLTWDEGLAGNTCVAGTFWDPVDGGGCWKCPSGANRTAFHSVKSGMACAKPGAEGLSAMCAVVKTLLGEEPDKKHARCLGNMIASDSAGRIMRGTGNNLPWKRMCTETGQVIFDKLAYKGASRAMKAAKAARAGKKSGKVMTAIKKKYQALLKRTEKIRDKAKRAAERGKLKEKMKVISKFKDAAMLVESTSNIWGPAAETFVDQLSAEVDRACPEFAPNLPAKQ